MSAKIESNWITLAKDRLSCGGLTVRELQALEIANIYDWLYAQDSTLIPVHSTSSVIDLAPNITDLYNKIACGELVSELQYAWAKAELSRLLKVYYESLDARLNAVVKTASHYVYAAGIHVWNDGASASGDIPVTGLLATDVVHVTLHTSTASELVEAAAAATGQINVTMSAAAADTTTKLNYTVYRAKPAS